MLLRKQNSLAGLRILVISLAFFLSEVTPVHSLGSGYADDLFKNKDYYRAIAEYKRSSFFSGVGEEKRWASFKIGESFRKSGRYEESIPHFLDASRFPPNDALTDSSSLSMARALIGMGSYETARHVLDGVGPDAGGEKAMLVGWTHFLESDYGPARQSFLLAPASANSHQLANMCILGARLPQKSVRTACLMSAAVPGTGQIYAGGYKQGIFSMALHGLMGYFFWYSMKEEMYLEAAVTLYTGLSRFYIGNISSANNLARDYNRRQREAILNEAESKYGSDLE